MRRNDREKKDKKDRAALPGLIFMLLWLLFALVNAVYPKKDVSASERRELAAFPSLGGGSLLDGRFERGFEEYAKDRILGRDAMVELDAAVSRALGNSLSGGVWIGRDGRLFSDPVIHAGEAAPSALAAVNRLADSWGFDVTLAVVPEAAEILTDDLPWAADGERLAEKCRTSWATVLAEDLSPRVRACDVTGPLLRASEKEDVYYHTDHHWTTAGARAALPEILKGLDQKAEAYTLEKVSSSFCGTLAAASGIRGAADEIFIPVPADGKETPVTVRIEGLDGVRTSVYAMEELESDDPYRVFMGGNYGMFTVKTAQEGKEKLLVLKDSYFNCLLPMLLRNYSEIAVVDARYFDGDPELLLYSMKGARVLVCYSRATFLTDQSLDRLIPEKAGTPEDPGKTEPGKTEPGKIEPGKTDPTETEPPETEPSETEPSETEPSETEPPKTESTETEPTESTPSEEELTLEAWQREAESNAVRFLTAEELAWFRNRLGDTAFIGDSIAQALVTENVLPESMVFYKRGVLLKEIDGLVDRAIAARPKNFVFVKGLGDVDHEDPPSYIVRYEGLIAKIRAAVPDANIYICALLPPSNALAATREDLARSWMFDDELRIHCPAMGATYIDLHWLVQQHLYLSDGIHFKASYYQLFLRYVTVCVKGWEGVPR